jgi:hypothetical protein
MKSHELRPITTSLAALVALAVAPACIIRPAVRPIPAPVFSAGRVTLPPIRPGLAPLVLDGAWATRADGRTCVDGGLVQLLLGPGPIQLQDAHLCVTSAPLSIDGEATVGFPGMGVLAQAGVHGDLGHARIRLAVGRDLGTIDLGGHRIKTVPDHYYMFLDLANGLDLTLGKARLTGPGASETVVVDVQDPLIYMAGQLRGPGVSIDGAFGFSLGGNLGLRPAVALTDGGRALGTDVTGQILVAGSMPVGDLPITISGDLLIDVDANRDGHTFFEGDPRDLRVLANGAVNLGYDKQGFGIELKLGDASVLADAQRGVVAIAGDGGGLLDGTPLAALSPARAHVDAFFRGPTDFAYHLTSETSILGQPTQQNRLTFDSHGVHMSTMLALPFGMGKVQVAGEVLANGKFALHGTAGMTIAGLHVAGARVDFTPAGIAIAGRVNFLGTGFDVHGGVRAGHVSMGGSVALNLAVFRGKIALSLHDTRVSALARGDACFIKACVPLGGMEIDAAGRVCPIFPIIGKKCIKIL